MAVDADRRTTLLSFGAALTLAGLSSTSSQAEADNAKLPEGPALAELSERLRKAPRRRDFKTVPMVLDNREFWDSAALSDVLGYKSVHKQAWDNTQLTGPWMNGMRNSLNSQEFSFRHPDFLVVSATHGPAHLALYDQEMWNKYKLADMTGGAFNSNTLIVRKDASADAGKPEDPQRKYKYEIQVVDEDLATVYFSDSITLEGSFVKFEPLYVANVATLGTRKNMEVIFPSHRVVKITHRKGNPSG